MKIVAVNGSPRVNWNTFQLLDSVLKGAGNSGAETELINLYELNFRGCVSCFACKTKGAVSYGKCAMRDDLSAVLEKVSKADALIMGSPVYFGSASSEMRAFMERLMYPFISYTNPPSSIFPGNLRVGMIYSMNATEEQFESLGIREALAFDEKVLKIAFGNAEFMYCHDTYQFKDYSTVSAERFDEEKKKKRRDEVFVKDLEKAFEMGKRLVSE